MRIKPVAVLTFLAPAILANSAPSLAAEKDARKVVVSAMAEVKVVPDQIVLTLGIATRDRQDLAAAKAANDRQTRSLLALAKKYRLSAEQVQVTTLSMGPRYKDRYEREFDHYEVTREIEFVLSNFETVEPLLTDAVAAGVTRVDDVLLRTTKNREMQMEARRRAVEYAKEKAAHLAFLNGLKLGKALEIQEDVEADRHTTGWGGAAAMVAPMASAGVRQPTAWPKLALIADSKDPTSRPEPNVEGLKEGELVPPGIIVVSATVSIRFEMAE